MKNHFVFMLVLLALLMTLQSDIRSADDIYNEVESSDRRYVNKKGEVWKVKQYGRDEEGKLKTSASSYAAQTKVYTHYLSVRASYQSKYDNPKTKGTWYLRAELLHDWATDQEPYEDEGKIKGRKNGMSESGSQSDKDWWTVKDPMSTITDCDAYAEAKVSKPAKHRSVSYSYFVPRFEDIEWIWEEAP